MRASIVRVGTSSAAAGGLIVIAQPAGALPLAKAAVVPVSLQQLHPATAPSSRTAATAAYDPATGQVVLFGGSGGTKNPDGTWEFAPLNDTWTFDGANWTKHATTTAPSPRDSSLVAYDPASKQLVLLKGNTSNPVPSNGDTWTWNGSQWTLRHAVAAAPGSARCMATDDALGEPVFFGGRDYHPSGPVPYVNFNGTWVWHNGPWYHRTEHCPKPIPPTSQYETASSRRCRSSGAQQQSTRPSAPRSRSTCGTSGCCRYAIAFTRRLSHQDRDALTLPVHQETAGY